MNSFVLDDSVLELILDAIARSIRSRTTPRRREHSSECLPAAPSKDILRQLVDTSFWASHRKEEAREVRFSVELSRPVEGNGSVEFRKPIAFGFDTLIKLCPALDPAQQSIGITESGGNLEIWGFRRKSRAMVGFGENSGLILEALEPC